MDVSRSLVINPLIFMTYEKIPSLWSPSSSPWSSSSRSRWLHVLMQCYHMITLKNGVTVPCGKCPACKANERQEWVFRLKQEYLASTFAVFVTLTYDDEHVPNGMNVSKSDVQKFHKRLRKHFPPGDLRYYVVSEYGDHTFRPHYHGLYFFKNDYQKDFIYRVFEESWQLGFLKFGEVEEGSIVYCTKYCLKHSKTPPGRLPTFRLVSKMNGGLGISYLDTMNDYHTSTLNLTSVFHNGKRFRMPRYYKSKLAFSSGVSLDQIKTAQEERTSQFYKRLCHESELSYNSFIEIHGNSNSIERYNDYLQKRADIRDELILKHCKNQKL